MCHTYLGLEQLMPVPWLLELVRGLMYQGNSRKRCTAPPLVGECVCVVSHTCSTVYMQEV